MTISITSPNVDNYVVGKGKIEWKPTGGDTWLDLGNSPVFNMEPGLERLDHFNSRSGVRTKDRSIILEKSATVSLELEEWTPRNLALFLCGAVVTDGTAVSIDILSLSEVTGALRYTAQNDVGPQWSIELPFVSFAPDGELEMISEEWAAIPLTGEVLYDSANDRFGIATAVFGAAAAPVNTIPPTLYGPAPQVGVEHFCYAGVWTGVVDTFTYQWEGEGVAIVGATSASYTPVVGDIGDTLTCVVTAVGPDATANEETAASAAVVAA